MSAREKVSFEERGPNASLLSSRRHKGEETDRLPLCFGRRISSFATLDRSTIPPSAANFRESSSSWRELGDTATRVASFDLPFSSRPLSPFEHPAFSFSTDEARKMEASSP